MLSEQQIIDCVIWACEQEVKAPKPGNVNCFSDAYSMEVKDFIASAEAIAPVMANPNLTVGQCILQSVQATRTVVDCNTNLGIILLFAPLCAAIRQARQAEEIPIQLERVLSALSVDDAKLTYQAIRLADAGGLGQTQQQDINDDPSVTLLEAMKLAAERDTIALQYVNNYQQIRLISLPALTQRITRGETVEWAIAFAYLKLLCRIPDTLIQRKLSVESSQAVTEKAKQFVFKMSENSSLKTYQSDLAAWDKELKQKDLNPGTSADLIAATLLLFRFERELSEHRISVP